MLLGGLAASLVLCAGATAGAPVTVTDYTDPGESVQWGQRSHWKQPWRSYLDTVPAETLLDAIGINFNVKPKLAAPTARLLAGHGFRRARVEVGWGSIDYDDPTRMNEADRRNLETTLSALRDNGIRPLILLNANQGKPCPVRHGSLVLAEPALAGATELHVFPGEVDEIVPGRTGIDSDRLAAGTLFASVEADGTVGLSRPLDSDLPAGPLAVVTLRYEPFRPAKLAGGEPNPAFEPTMQGWLRYVGAVTSEAESILGSEEFDVEIWNELSFGSGFLNANAYYEPDIEWTSGRSYGEILYRTVDYLRDPANGVAGIGIGNGFANQSPWWSGTKSHVGVTAIDKHPYAGRLSFPAEAQVNGNRPLNGLGEPAWWRDSEGGYHELFTPAYEAFFPEYFLSAIQTETLARDLSPYPTPIQGTPHGRYTHPPGGDPPEIWITEVNLGPGSGPAPRAEMSDADRRHIATKNVLRYLTAYVNKGVTAIDFFAAQAGDLSLIDPAFLAAAKADPSAYPGDALGGETMDAVGRLADSMRGAGPISTPRSLELRELTDFSGNVQFEGDGTAANPPLYNRDVLAFLPFQAGDDRFAIPVYVMTRNVAEAYRPGADPGRFDLPPEPYRLAIGGVDGQTAQASATDPLSGEPVPVEVVSRAGDKVVVEMPVTDSPRLLSIEDRGYEPPPVGETGETGEAGEAQPPSSPAAPETAAAPLPGAPEPVASRPGRRPAAATVAPALLVKDGARLLKGGRMAVVAGCESSCLIDLGGRLLIGPRRYPMRPNPRGRLLGAAPGAPARVELSLGKAAVRLALFRARRRGATVKVAVAARARPVGPGGAGVARQVLLLSR